MKPMASRLMLAIVGGLMWAGPAVEARDVRFSELESRLAAVERLSGNCLREGDSPHFAARSFAIDAALSKMGTVPDNFRTASECGGRKDGGVVAVAYVSDGQRIDAIAPNEPVTGDSPDEAVSSVLTEPARLSERVDEFYETPECCESPVPDAPGAPCDGGSVPMGGYFGQAEFLFLRPNVAELAAGKLSEKYELAPRFVFGYESAGGVGGRARYWTYGRTTQILNADADIRFEFDVYDAEATSRFRTKRSELVVGGGLRFARVEVDLGGQAVGNDLAGLTLAADLRTHLCGDCQWEWSAVCGARFSLLGGDWEGDGEGLVAPVRDDNVVTQELYGGLEYVQRMGTCNVFTRLVFEIQNWHSDALAQTGGTDSIGLIGPGVQVGGTF